jgi:hypothetical protein
MATTTATARAESGTKAKSKSRTEAKSKSETKAKFDRAEINRRNAQKSTGPRSAAGKERSRFNALKHGMTARSALLPDEDASELAARQQEAFDDLQPRSRLEAILVERIASDIWRSDRAEHATNGRLAFRIRHEALEQASAEKDEALKLGERLFSQPAFPLPISARFCLGELTEPPLSDDGIHPHNPARLVLSLEQTIAGCDWLLSRWSELIQRLEVERLWLSSDPFKMVRLMGKHAIDMADDLEVVRVFLCSLALFVVPQAGPGPEPFDWKAGLIKMLTSVDVEADNGIAEQAARQCEPFTRRLAEMPLAALAPTDGGHARQWLAGTIKREIERLTQIRYGLKRIADADLAEAPARLAFETGPEGERQRRYILSNERLLNRRIDEFLKVRKASEAGTLDHFDGRLSVVSCPLPANAAGSGPDANLGAGDPSDVGDPCIGPAEIHGILPGQDHVKEPPDEMTRPDFERQTSVESPEQEITCDSERFLRNEANPNCVALQNEATDNWGDGPNEPRDDSEIVTNELSDVWGDAGIGPELAANSEVEYGVTLGSSANYKEFDGEKPIPQRRGSDRTIHAAGSPILVHSGDP